MNYVYVLTAALTLIALFGWASDQFPVLFFSLVCLFILLLHWVDRG